jgi:hypothetical protein
MMRPFSGGETCGFPWNSVGFCGNSDGFAPEGDNRSPGWARIIDPPGSSTAGEDTSARMPVVISPTYFFYVYYAKRINSGKLHRPEVGAGTIFSGGRLA